MSLRALAGAAGPLLALALIIILFALADRWRNGETTFLGTANARMIAVQTSTVAVAALGMTVVIIAGGIDLSAGTALALSATVLAWCLKAGYSVAAALAACLATGLAAGLLNGLLVSLLGVVPFIVTLGTMSIYLGLAKIVADETTVRPGLEQVPGWLSQLVSPSVRAAWFGLAPGVWIALVLAAIVAAVLRQSVFGRHVFAIGSSEPTARLCGIHVGRTKVAVYTLAGLFVGIAGMYQFGRLSVGNPTSGIGMELRIIAAVVIGGASLSGGRGSILGTLAGAVMMSVIESGCTLLEVSNSIQDVLIGLIIIAAVWLDRLRTRS